MDWTQLSDQSFTKWVDGLGSEPYRQLFNSDPDFVDRINGGTAWQEHKDQEGTRSVRHVGTEQEESSTQPGTGIGAEDSALQHGHG